ncbi:MAG TPA: S8 family serine peptidase [Candidatus Deferrimicrobium sp.]|nr:S8 family serine peptidase [Candidatus Deferrimicrobium sp.]
MKSHHDSKRVFLALLAVMLFVDVPVEAMVSSSQDKPRPHIIPGVATVVFEDGVDLFGVTKGFGTVSFGLPSFDQLLDGFGVSQARNLFPWHSERPAAGSGQIDMTRYYEITFDTSFDVRTVVAALMQNPNVRLAEPVWALPVDASPNDPQWGNQWAMEPPPPDPDYYDAWDMEAGSDSIKFACIDSGVNYKHSDLKGHIWVNPGEDVDGDMVVYDLDDLNNVDNDGNGVTDDLIGYDFLTGLSSTWPGEDGFAPDPNPSDFGGHGTHVAGIAAAMTNNAVGVTGVAGGWHGGSRSLRGVQIMCIRVGGLAADGLQYVNSNDCGTAISYAANNGAHVINASWGSSNTETMIAGMAAAAAAGITVVHAAGNDNMDDPDYLDFDVATEVLSVAALGPSSDVKAGFSNFGDWIDVSAPGSSILSTSSELGVPGYLYYQGTSMAAPMVSGLALLIRSAMPSLTKEQVDSLIINTADSIDHLQDPLYVGQLGSGRINAYKALIDLASARFTADITEGLVPLAVQFTDQSPNSPSSWLWRFGTSDTSVLQNPTYTYTAPGIYDVSLIVDEGNPLGLGEEHLKHYVWVRADTCHLDSVYRALGQTQIVLPVYLANTVQLSEIQFAFQFTNSNNVTLDSFSTAGLRTDYFYSVGYSAQDGANQRYAILLKSSHADSSNYLMPDTGAILKLYFKTNYTATAGVITVDTATVGGKEPRVSSIWGNYWPVFQTGKMVIPFCTHGDVNCDGDVNISDLTALVGYVFFFQGPIDGRGGDVTGNGFINIEDVTYLVAFLFQGGPPPPA